ACPARTPGRCARPGPGRSPGPRRGSRPGVLPGVCAVFPGWVRVGRGGRSGPCRPPGPVPGSPRGWTGAVWWSWLSFGPCVLGLRVAGVCTRAGPWGKGRAVPAVRPVAGEEGVSALFVAGAVRFVVGPPHLALRCPWPFRWVRVVGGSGLCLLGGVLVPVPPPVGWCGFLSCPRVLAPLAP